MPFFHDKRSIHWSIRFDSQSSIHSSHSLFLDSRFFLDFPQKCFWTIVAEENQTWVRPDLSFSAEEFQKINANVDSEMKLCLKIQRSVAILPFTSSNTWIAQCIFGEWWAVITFETQWCFDMMTDDFWSHSDADHCHDENTQTMIACHWSCEDWGKIQLGWIQNSSHRITLLVLTKSYPLFENY
jgi:hypothetical protein